MTHDIDHLTHMTHALVGSLSYQLNHRGGYLDKLDRAIGDEVTVAEHGAPALRLCGQVKTLRALADALEERCEALTGRAPRLQLIAAE